ncbi:MAG: type II toxin-antitoxin system PemK/MazF family toxin [Prosthecobacter sp.]
MKAWDIYSYEFQDAGAHPAVIVSHPDRVAKAEWVNVLLCTTHAARAPKETEVRLNGADGLDWETLCRCDALWLVEKSKLKTRRGTVSHVRRRQIVDKINASMGWKLV